MLKIIIIFLVTNKVVTAQSIDLTEYERNVKFFVFNNTTADESFNSIFSNSLNESDCDSNGKFAFVVHGWEESIQTLWVSDTIRNLAFYRGGCVIFMDYSFYSKNLNYFGLASHFNALARLLAQKIQQIVADYDNVFMFGFSFGARLCFEAGGIIGYQTIDQMIVCDSAGPAFDSSIDPTLAAKYVYCINTSVNYGTNSYNCHINFRMGICGRIQIGAKPKPCGSHGLCPYFFNSAFENNFTSNNFYKCRSSRMAYNIPDDFRMGYMETRRSHLYYGDVFIPTAKTRPWNVVNVTDLQ